MQNFLESIWSRILRLLLTVAVPVIGAVPGSYLKEVPQFHEDGTLKAVDAIRTSYFAFAGNGLMDFLPLICMILAIGAAIAGVIAIFKETEKSLMFMATLLSFAIVAQTMIIIFLAPTVLGWCIAGLLAISLALTAVQEMKLEDKNKQH